ncbi:MAG: hypothetical protein ACOCVM_04830, partial [Desulfovibrionaceae bacterium]
QQAALLGPDRPRREQEDQNRQRRRNQPRRQAARRGKHHTAPRENGLLRRALRPQRTVAK